MTGTSSATPPAATLLQLMTGCWVTQAIYIAAKLGIADLLQDEPKAPAELAEATRTDAGALYRVLRALASVGIFAEDGDGRFHLTPMAERLQSDAPRSLRSYAVMLGEPEHWRAWGDALYSIQTGRPAFEHIFGMPLFEYWEQHPNAARIFDAAMTSRSNLENEAIVTGYDFSSARTVIDVGGGQGTLLGSILRSNPPLKGVLFDLPRVITAAETELEDLAHPGRCAFASGSFFDAVPTGGDVYLLKRIIHDWDDDRARTILENCREAMPQSGRLLLLETIVPPGNDPSPSKLLDLQMLVLAGGVERTEAQYRTLLSSVGLELRRVIPTQSTISILKSATQRSEHSETKASA